jgi:hypothetical protein
LLHCSIGLGFTHIGVVYMDTAHALHLLSKQRKLIIRHNALLFLSGIVPALVKYKQKRPSKWGVF